jgi:hypothetical protein
VKTLFVISYVCLWLLVAALYLAVLLLYRQYGHILMNSRDGRQRQGPEVDTAIEPLRGRDLTGTLCDVAAPQYGVQLIYFASTLCDSCKEARQSLSLFADEYRSIIKTWLVCGGRSDDILNFVAPLSSAVTVVSDPKWKLGTKLRISSTPFALLIDEKGIVRAKGMPDNKPEAFQWFAEQVYGPANEFA